MQYLVLLALCLGSAMARPDGAGGHHDHGHGHGHHSAPAAAAPASGYAEPQAAYSEPATGYSEPTGYAAPTGYESSGYQAAPSGYGGNSGYAVAEESGIDMNMILIPILIIAGLALLFPSVTTVDVNAGRRKRSTEEEVSGNSLVERVQDIYMAVVESEECMERVVCELGGIAADAGINTKAISMASAFVPNKYSKMMRKFGTPSNCHKIKCGSLF